MTKREFVSNALGCGRVGIWPNDRNFRWRMSWLTAHGMMPIIGKDGYATFITPDVNPPRGLCLRSAEFQLSIFDDELRVLLPITPDSVTHDFNTTGRDAN